MAKELKTDKYLDEHLSVVKSGEESSSLELATQDNGARIRGDLEVTGTTKLNDVRLIKSTGTSVSTANAMVIQPGGGRLIVKSGHTSANSYPALVLQSIGSGATDGAKINFQTMPRHDNTTPNDDDELGKITWSGATDSDPDTTIGQEYAGILVEAKDVSGANEKGKFIISVSTDNGISANVSEPGLIIEGTTTNERVDVTLANGSTSVTTVSGDLDIDGNEISVVGALEIDAGGQVSITGQDVSVDTTKKIFLDGGSTTYIVESGDGIIDLVVNGLVALRLDKGGVTQILSDDVRVLNELGSTYVGNHAASFLTKTQINAAVVSEGTIQVAELEISEAQMNDLHTAERTIVSAQGSGKVIVPTSGMLFIDRDGSTAQTGAADLIVGWNGADSVLTEAIYYIRKFMFNEAGDRIFHLQHYSGECGQSLTAGDNQPLTVKLTGAITSGSIDGMKVVISYYVYDNS